MPLPTTVEEHREQRRQHAAEAMARGQQALVAGDLEDAERWLSRAERVAGGNDAVALLLATLRLRRGDSGQAVAFAQLAERHDLREAWIGLASALARAGDMAAAALALGRALSGHAGDLPPPLHSLATAIATQTGTAGWAALSPDGAVWLRPALPYRLSLDGESMPTEAIPPAGRSLAVTTPRGAPLGSPFDLARMARIEGFVAAEGDGIAGWAWLPNSLGQKPALRVLDAAGAGTDILLGVPEPMRNQADDPHARPLAMPYRIAIPASALGGPGPYRIVGPDGRGLTGSPLDPSVGRRTAQAVCAAVAGRPADGALLAHAPLPTDLLAGVRAAAAAIAAEVAVVVPVYRGLEATLACLDSVFAHSPPNTRVIVVDDAGPEPALADALDALAATGRIALIRHTRNRGFPGAANAGLLEARRADVVLLNADTLVPPGWIDRLRAVAARDGAIGTVTPLSNDATILSYPSAEGGNPVPTLPEVTRLARLAATANGAAALPIPTAIGFCMYVTRACLDEVGLLREDVFAQGYGEENDFCLRASHLGWRHVAAPGLFVGHVGGVSFGAARAHLLARNLAILNRLHPGYEALIAAGAFVPAIAAARRRLDLARLGAVRRGVGSVILISHDVGGGVERQLDRRREAIRAEGLVPITLRPVLARPLLQGTGHCRVAFDPDDWPNLDYDVETEFPTLLRLLAGRRPARVEVHHLLGHDHRLLALPARLGVPYEVHLHDYAWFCPRVTLVTGERRYCGEPDLSGCAACIADYGANIDEDIPVAALVARSAADLAGAARVVAANQDVAARFARHFPGLAAAVLPWDAVLPPPPRSLPPPSAGRPRVVGVLGGVGIEKGFDVLLACARDAAARGLNLRFVLLGHSIDDARLLDTGAVFITGEYKRAELPGLVRSHGVDLAFLPSIWPETWCFTLSEAWEAGLNAVVFDLGAPAERVRRQGGGAVLPLGLPAPRVNGWLMA